MCDMRQRSRPPRLRSSLLPRLFLYYNERTGFVPSKKRMRHESLICGTSVISMCDMTHPYVWHETSILTPTTIIGHATLVRGPWLVYVGHEFFVCGTWLVCMCDMRRQSRLLRFQSPHFPQHFFFVHPLYWCGWTGFFFSQKNSWTRVIHTLGMSRLFVGHELFVCGTWLVHMCAIRHGCRARDMTRWLDVCGTWLVCMCAIQNIGLVLN